MNWQIIISLLECSLSSWAKCLYTHTHTESISPGTQSQAEDEDITCHCSKPWQLSHTSISYTYVLLWTSLVSISLIPCCVLNIPAHLIMPLEAEFTSNQNNLYISMYLLYLSVLLFPVMHHICIAEPWLLSSYFICFIISLCYVVCLPLCSTCCCYHSALL